MVTKDQKVHHVWGSKQHHGVNTGKVNMQQLQRSSDNDGSYWGFGTNAFMLDALLIATDCPLHLSGHAGPPELVMHKAQYPLLALVPSIMGTFIHGGYPVSLGDHESQSILQFTSRGVVVESSLVKH